MATQEKLLKSLESIKNLANSNLTSDIASRYLQPKKTKIARVYDVFLGKKRKSTTAM